MKRGTVYSQKKNVVIPTLMIMIRIG